MWLHLVNPVLAELPSVKLIVVTTTIIIIVVRMQRQQRRLRRRRRRRQQQRRQQRALHQIHLAWEMVAEMVPFIRPTHQIPQRIATKMARTTPTPTSIHMAMTRVITSMRMH